MFGRRIAWRGGATTKLELQSLAQKATKQTKGAASGPEGDRPPARRETNGSSFSLLPSVQNPWLEDPRSETRITNRVIRRTSLTLCALCITRFAFLLTLRGIYQRPRNKKASRFSTDRPSRLKRQSPIRIGKKRVGKKRKIPGLRSPRCAYPKNFVPTCLPLLFFANSLFCPPPMPMSHFGCGCAALCIRGSISTAGVAGQGQVLSLSVGPDTN